MLKVKVFKINISKIISNLNKKYNYIKLNFK